MMTTFQIYQHLLKKLTFNQRLEKAISPFLDKETCQPQAEMGFNCWEAICELIYLMVTCCPDISYKLITIIKYAGGTI